MSSVKEKLDKVKEQRDDARKNFENSRLVFDKCCGAIEILEVLLKEEEDLKEKKDKKK